MAILNEGHATTSTKYIAEQDIVMTKLLYTLQSFCSHFPVFTSEKYPKNLNFQSFFLPPK